MPIDQLARLKPSDLPSPPQASLQILRACSRDNISLTELAQLIGSDPVLTAELLRIVNTPLFGLSRQVQSLNQAISLLGQRALRNLVLCMSVRDAVNQHAIAEFDTTLYWEDALRRASSARLLGKQVAADHPDFFTDGLLQDFGLLAMYYLNPAQAADYPQLLQLNPAQRHRREQELFGVTHADIIQLLLKSWGLPDELGRILGHHHRCAQAGLRPEALHICQVLHCADWMAAVYSASNKGEILEQTQALLTEVFDLDHAQITALLDKVPAATEAAAQSLGLRITQQPDFDQIMRQANVKLVEENLGYQELTWELEQALKQRDRLAAELDDELQLAREVQESLLPRSPAENFPLTAITIAARHLSGDFYDYFCLPDGRIYFALADVSGKGITAALLMVKTSSLFHCLGKHVDDPARLLHLLNNEICETSIRGMFVSMIAGIYDPVGATLSLVNAGHPPALVLGRDGYSETVEAMGPPLGILPDTGYPSPVTLDLAGRSLYLFTDGLTESQAGQGQMLGVSGLIELLREYAGLAPRERLQAVVERVKPDSERLKDDITILLIENVPARHTLLELRFPARTAELKTMREQVRQALQQHSCSEQCITETVLGINEACMNIIQHAYGAHGLTGDILLEIHRQADWLTFRLTDFAPPVDRSKCNPRDLDDLRPGGLGTHFISSVMDTAQFIDPPTGIGNILELRKQLRC